MCYGGVTPVALLHGLVVLPGSLWAGHKEFWRLNDSFGWYDLALAVNADSGFLRHFAGHLEAGAESMSDPAIGKRRPD